MLLPDVVIEISAQNDNASFHFACSPFVHVGSLQVLCLPPTVQRHASMVWSIGHPKLLIGV